jgi:HSP20 family molecular chaperone IbpA
MSGFRDVGRVGESALSAVLERIGRGAAKVQERKPLSYDLLESDDAYLVVFDAPGATSSDVNVRFLDGEVQVRLDRFREYHEGFEMRFPGRGLALDGRATLPPDAAVEPDGASATLRDNGSLEVRIPKSGDAHDIAVEDAENEVDAAIDPTTEEVDERTPDEE